MPEDVSTCPVCGVPRPARLGSGLCAACLLSLALDDDEGGSQAAPGGGPAHSYQVISVLDHQAERTRYLARRRDFHSLVALEIVSPSVVTRSGERAVEARLNQLRSLRHPGIARHLESWIEPTGECCLVSEYSAGRSLAHGADLQDGQALSIFDAVCEAIAAAHDVGVTHGLLSARSIVLIPSGPLVVPRVVDLTITGAETAFAEDVAALGRILEALCANRPFAAAGALLAARCAGQGEGPPLGAVRDLQAAATAIR